MPTDLLDQISAINPLPEDLAPPPIASLLALPERDARPASAPPPPASAARSPSAPLALPIAAVGARPRPARRGGGGSSTSPPPSTRRRSPATASTTCSSKAKPARQDSLRRWSTTDPLRERAVQGNGRKSSNWSAVAASVGLVHRTSRGRSCASTARRPSAGGIPCASSSRPIARAGCTCSARRPSATAPPIAQRSGRATATSGPIVIVDAHTYMPIEMIYRGPESSAPALVVHVRSYEELPATSANLTLVRLAHHTGAHVVKVTRHAAR